MDYQGLDKPATARPLIVAAIAAVVALAAGGWFYWHGPDAAMPKMTAGAQPEVPASAAAPEERIEHPVPAAQTGAPSGLLPDLNDSDKPLADAFAAAAGGLSLAQFLVPESLVRHIVVTVDNLPRQKIALDKRPIAATAGTLMVEGDELHATLDSRNFQRYAPMIDIVRKLDMQHFAAVYLHFYPLFQKAFQDLGYPTGYFNDRLVKVIDLLLATPQIAAPIDLVRPNVMYVFADPKLESLPAGQKVLIRIGPENAAAVKTKLMELRAIVTAGAPTH